MSPPDPIREVLPFARFYLGYDDEDGATFTRRLRAVFRRTDLAYKAIPSTSDRELLAAYYDLIIKRNPRMLAEFTAYQDRMHGRARASDPVPQRSTAARVHSAVREPGALPSSIVPRRQARQSRLLASRPVMEAQQRATRERHRLAQRARARERLLAAQKKREEEAARGGGADDDSVLDLVFSLGD